MAVTAPPSIPAAVSAMAAAVSAMAAAPAGGAANRWRVVNRTTQPNANPIATEAIAAKDLPGSRSLSRLASAPRAT
jgi:hypothetical protein